MRIWLKNICIYTPITFLLSPGRRFRFPGPFWTDGAGHEWQKRRITLPGVDPCPSTLPPAAPETKSKKNLFLNVRIEKKNAYRKSKQNDLSWENNGYRIPSFFFLDQDDCDDNPFIIKKKEWKSSTLLISWRLVPSGSIPLHITGIPTLPWLFSYQWVRGER